MSAATAESLLTKAAALYKRAEMDYRDNLLSVGRLLHEFVFTSLRATDGRWRQHRPVTREGLMAEAAKKLDVRLHRVTELIIPAMTVDLLSGKGGYGNLGIRSLLRFGVLIHRPQRGTETTQASLYENVGDQTRIQRIRSSAVSTGRCGMLEHGARRTGNRKNTWPGSCQASKGQGMSRAETCSPIAR